MRGAYDAIKIVDIGGGFVNQAAEDEGIWGVTSSSATYYGSVHQKNPEERDDVTIGQRGERKQIVCRLPLSATVKHGDQVLIESINAAVNGSYEIDGISFTQTHVRVTARRTVTNA